MELGTRRVAQGGFEQIVESGQAQGALLQREAGLRVPFLQIHSCAAQRLVSAEFPYTLGFGAMVDVLGGRRLLTREGTVVEAEAALQNKVVALYFAAGRCAPSRDFTPLLCDFYTALVSEARRPAPFEVVFVSADRSAEEMLDFMRDLHGAWLALPFHDPYRHELKRRYDVTAIPKLVVIKPNGAVITNKGRKQIRERGLACFQNWVEAADVFQNFLG